MIGVDMEGMIFGDLMEDVVRDLWVLLFLNLFYNFLIEVVIRR